MKNENIDEQNYQERILNVFEAMNRMEMHKYLEPKLSISCKDLIKRMVSDRKATEMNHPQKDSIPISILAEMYIEDEFPRRENTKIFNRVKHRLQNDERIDKSPNRGTNKNEFRLRQVSTPQNRSKSPYENTRTPLTYRPSLTLRDPILVSPNLRPTSQGNGFLYARNSKSSGKIT